MRKVEIALESVFGFSLAAAAATFVAVALGRLGSARAALVATALGILAVLGRVAAALELVLELGDGIALALAAGGIAACAAAAGCTVVLARSLERLGSAGRLTDAAIAQLDAVLAVHAEERAAELERTLLRERSHASHLLGEQERELAGKRRDEVARQIETARNELGGTLASLQDELRRRLGAWTADLNRGQLEFKEQLDRLSHRQREAIAEYDARLEADAIRLRSASEEQRRVLAEIRAEFETLAGKLLEEGRAELDVHAAERRRALHEVGERLRARERTMRELVEREEAEARARLSSELPEVERRFVEQLARQLNRATTRAVEEGERRFDAQIREAREKSAERLGRELDRYVDDFARRAEKDVSDRIAQVAQVTADRLQKRLAEAARIAEAQQELSAERVGILTERLNKALAQAEERINAFEAHIEVEMETRRAELERAMRAAEASR